MVTNSLEVDKRILEAVIQHLMDADNLSLRDHTEREQSLLELLQTNKLSHLKASQLLHMSLHSKCYRVAEQLYELQKDFSFILPCYINDSVRKNEVFNYILNFINVSERCIQQQFLVHFKDLVKISSQRTGEIVTEYFPTLIEQFCAILENDFDLQYSFLSEIVTSDIKLPPRIAESYLEQLCIKNKNEVCNYLQLRFCRNEEALELTTKYGVHSATALLLEQGGEWMEALELLLNNNMMDEAVNLCIRGAEHLDSEGEGVIHYFIDKKVVYK